MIAQNHLIYRYLASAMFVVTLFCHPVAAATGIAVLQFELKDLTLRPRLPEELQRTSSIKPLLEKHLQKDQDYYLIHIDKDAQRDSNAGTGYLFAHHDIAANLGKKFNAQYIVVGRLHKPSFLFAYLMAHVIEVNTNRLIGNFIVEVKGPQKKITAKGVETLANKIKTSISSFEREK